MYPILRSYILLRSHWIIALLIGLAQGWDCGVQRDPHNTLDHVRAGTLRVGIADAPPWARFSSEGNHQGLEVELITSYAQHLNAKITWVPGPQDGLLEQLERFELDVVIGGLTKKSPWAKRVGVTMPYLTEHGHQRKLTHEHVMAVPPGENGFLLSLDRHLQVLADEPKVISSVGGW